MFGSGADDGSIMFGSGDDDGSIRIPSDGEKNDVRRGDRDSENGKDLAGRSRFKMVTTDPSLEFRFFYKEKLIFI